MTIFLNNIPYENNFHSRIYINILKYVNLEWFNIIYSDDNVCIDIDIF